MTIIALDSTKVSFHEEVLYRTISVNSQFIHEFADYGVVNPTLWNY